MIIFRSGIRLSSARAYLRPARHRPNLHIMLNSTATKTIVDQKDGLKNVSNIKFIFQKTEYEVKIRKELVVAAGAINSPQILMLSD